MIEFVLTETSYLSPKVCMQVKWHLWTYPTASPKVFLYMTYCMQVQRYSLVSYCQSNPSSHQERLVTMVMDYNTGPHACQRVLVNTIFPQLKTSMCSGKNTCRRRIPVVVGLCVDHQAEAVAVSTCAVRPFYYLGAGSSEGVEVNLSENSYMYTRTQIVPKPYFI